MLRRTLVLVSCLLIVSVSTLAGDAPDRKPAPQELAAQAKPAENSQVRGYLHIDGSVVPFWSYSAGVQNASGPVGGGGGVGKAVFQDVALMMPPSAASPKLWLACVQGKHFAQAKVEVVDSKGVRLVEFHLTDVLISSYQTGGSVGGLNDQLTLTFAGIEYILIGL